MKLSNTAINTYTTCPQKYKFHYLDKIRPDSIASALHFGKALDSALNVLLLEKADFPHTIEKSAEDTFLEEFTAVDINGTKYSAFYDDKIKYTKGDCDISLLEEYDYLALALLEDYDVTRANIYDVEKDCHEMLKNDKKIHGDLLKVWNAICFLSLSRKGRLLLEAYKIDIMPQIRTVHSIQTAINLPNGSGDEITGFIDFEATFQDGVRRVMDNKTSSKAYTDQDLDTSQQLALYSEFCENRNVGYAVLIKTLRVKAPRVRTQLVFGKISEDLIEKTFDTVGEVEYNVKEGKFDKKLDACFQFGQKCPYYAFCRDSSNITGLIGAKKIEEEI